MRSSTLLASGAVLLFGPLGSAAAESSSLLHMPRDGPLPISQLYLKPIKGKSTYYGHYLGGGSCGLDQLDGSAIPKEIQGIDWTVALDREQFYQGGCGMCIEVHGQGLGSGGDPVKGKYKVFVNNLCPECEYGHLDVAEPGDGLWDIMWKAVPCDVGEHKMRFQFMGSNDFYLKLSAQGTPFPTKRLRLKLDGQQWVDGVPVHGSYFEFREGAPFRFPLEVEVTSVHDEVLTDWIQSVEGGPSKIQYRKKPTDDEEMADIAVPGQEKERPAYETLSEMAEEYRYGPASTQVETDAFAARRRPFLGEEEEPEEERAEDDERARWGTNQYLRGRPNPRSAF